jgi:hypothetical protein
MNNNNILYKLNLLERKLNKLELALETQQNKLSDFTKESDVLSENLYNTNQDNIVHKNRMSRKSTTKKVIHIHKYYNSNTPTQIMYQPQPPPQQSYQQPLPQQSYQPLPQQSYQPPPQQQSYQPQQPQQPPPPRPKSPPPIERESSRSVVEPAFNRRATIHSMPLPGDKKTNAGSKPVSTFDLMKELKLKLEAKFAGQN